MNRDRRIFKSLWLPVFIVFITIFIPNTLFAGPAPKCPCFSAGQIERDISKAVEGGIECARYTGSIPYYSQSYGDMDIAQITIIQSTGIVRYSMFGDVEAKLGIGYPSCGTMEMVSAGDEVSGKTRVDIITDLSDQTSMAACVAAIMEAYPGCSTSTVNYCTVLEDFIYPSFGLELQCIE